MLGACWGLGWVNAKCGEGWVNVKCGEGRVNAKCGDATPTSLKACNLEGPMYFGVKYN